jgi:hypothetical protein
MSKRQPWDIPPHTEQYDTSADFVFNAVGRALTKWEIAEQACARLFAIFVGAHQDSAEMTPAVRAYGSVVSFNGRCEMLRSAAEAYFAEHPHKGLETDFRSLIGECQSYSARRNEIAHGTVVALMDGETDQRLGFVLVPNFYNPKKYSLERKLTYQYSSKEILFFAGRFAVLATRVEVICLSLQGKFPST